MGKGERIKQFRRLTLEQKLIEIFKIAIDIQDQEKKLPPEFCNRLYTVSEATEHVKMSREWILKQIRTGKIKAKYDKNKYYLSWETIQSIIESRNKRY